MRCARRRRLRWAVEMPIVEVSGLNKTFGSGDLAVHELRDINFTVDAGDLVALLGPSGSSNSTLLLCMSLILAPSSGRVVMNGRTVYDAGATGLDVRRFRRENIGFIFQANNLIPFLNARENISLVLHLNGAAKREAARRAQELLEYLEIGHRAASMPANLSGGEQQRGAIGG